MGGGRNSTMRRIKKSTINRPDVGRKHVPRGNTVARGNGASLWEILTKPRSLGAEVSSRDLTFLLKNLATLTEHGVSLPKALSTLADEKALEKHRNLLQDLRRRLENGESFSFALSQHSSTFDTVMVSQVKVGERTGAIPDTLRTIAAHREKAGRLRSEIIRKLSYPILLITIGTGVIVFLMIVVVPVFETTYNEAGVPLPMVTQILIAVGNTFRSYGWAIVAVPLAVIVAYKQIRKNEKLALKIDKNLLRLPLFGNWLRDISVLQLMDVLGALMEAGFTLAEALGESAESVGNYAVKQSVARLQSAVHRGERFSREIERMGEMFPPIVSQLVIVGEQTGNLASATLHIRHHLEEEIDRKTNILVGTLEPVLTISLAAAIGTILLAIYLPMFDMINTVGG